jgi:hypothetical protein
VAAVVDPDRGAEFDQPGDLGRHVVGLQIEVDPRTALVEMLERQLDAVEPAQLGVRPLRLLRLGRRQADGPLPEPQSRLRAGPGMIDQDDGDATAMHGRTLMSGPDTQVGVREIGTPQHDPVPVASEVRSGRRAAR